MAAAPLDSQKFRDAYERFAGEAYEGDVPSTLDDLFDRLHDPDEFDEATTATLLAACTGVSLRATVLDEDPLIGEVTVFAGDVHAKRDFTFNSHVLVLGDLVVDGVLTASPAHAILMVAGNISCLATHLIRAYLFVTGNLMARECFFGCAYGNAKVAGSIETPIYLADDSWANLRIDDALDAPSRVKNIASPVRINIDAGGARAKLAKHLISGALGDSKMDFGDGHEDLHELLAKIARGERVRR